MSTQRICAKCGAVVSASAPDGLCVNCLLDAASDPETEFTKLDPPQSSLETKSKIENPKSQIATLGRFGDYDLLEEIARGGMGVVYKARQRRLDRIVAVKMILAGQFAGKQIAQRFRGEAGAAAILQHPNIVAVHDVGVEDGQHFFSMDYVEGQDLAQLVGNRPLPASTSARYVKLLAEAIHYSHQQGILHRDLKPSNVLIDAATDQPRITDFGSAKRLEGESSITVTGQVLGSPNFMPPEQASGSRGKVGRHSDVYGLGGILYYTLTARAPFQGATLETAIHEVLNTEPLSPRLLNPGVPRDLETICLKCLEKEPAKRYTTAQQLADELGRFLNGEPIRARPVSRPERAWRWCRRKPGLAGSLISVAFLFLIVVIGSPIAAFRIAAARNMARHNLYAADMKQVQQAWESGNARLAVTLLEAQRPARGQDDLRGFEWRYYWKLCQGVQTSAFRGHAKAISFVAFGPDSKTITSASLDGMVRFWSGQNYREFPVPYRSDVFPVPVTVSSDGQTLAWGGSQIRLWHTQPMREVAVVWPDAYMVSALAFSGEGKKLAAAGHVRALSQIRIWDLASNQPALVITNLPYYAVRKGTILSVAFDPRGDFLAAGGALGFFKMWDVSTGRELSLSTTQPIDNRIEIHSIAFSPDSKWVAIPQGKAVILLDLNTGAMSSLTIEEQGEEAVQALFSPDGDSLAVGTVSGIIELLDAKSHRRQRSLIGHTEAISSLAFSADGRSIVSGSFDKSLRVWNISEKREGDSLRGHTDSVLCLAVSPDGRTLASGSLDGTIKLWDTTIMQELATLGSHNHRIRSLCFSPDGLLLVSTSGDETEEGSPLEPGDVKLWDVARRSALSVLEGLTNAVRSAAFSPDRRTLAIAAPYAAELWNVSTRREVAMLLGPERSSDERLTVAAFSPNGRTLALGSYGHDIELWDAASRRQRAVLRGSKAGAECLAFSPDGKLLASGSRDLLVRLWEVGSQKLLAAIPGHKALTITSITFSPDGKTLASGGADGTVRLWSVAAFREVATVRSDKDKVSAVTFSPDGQVLYSGNGDGTIRLWRATSFAETNHL